MVRLLHEHLQPGTGSFDQLAGLSDAYGMRPWTQVPALTKLDGVQSEHPARYLTLSYDFSL